MRVGVSSDGICDGRSDEIVGGGERRGESGRKICSWMDGRCEIW